MYSPSSFQSQSAGQSHCATGDSWPVSRAERQSCDSEINVGDTERTLSAIAGGGLLLFGLSRLSLTGLLGIAVGGALLYRGIKGHCSLYAALDMTTAEGRPEGTRGRYGSPSSPRHGVTEASLAATGESPPSSR